VLPAPYPYTAQYLKEVSEIAARLDRQVIDRLVRSLVELRGRGGRLFILGRGWGRRQRHLCREREVSQDVAAVVLKAVYWR
jgi:hypothetical protein